MFLEKNILEELGMIGQGRMVEWKINMEERP